jgi:F0F1-type ATP synthase membrane subunit b/b'
MDSELRAYLDEMRAELRTEIQGAAAEIRTELRAEIQRAADEVRIELREQIRRSADEVRTGLREEIRRSADEVRIELSAKIEDSAETLRRHFGVVTEGLRWELRVVAEGTLGNAAAIDRLEVEMNRRFVSAEAAQRAAFDDFREQLGDVRRDLAELRAGR